MRYILFAGAYYYPNGGADDIKTTSDDLEGLKIIAEPDDLDEWMWVQIYDTQIGEVIWEGSK